MDTVTHHGRETAYRTVDRGGAGPAVLAVHGSGGTHRVWTPQSTLADEYPITALDLSGHGESDDVAAEPGYETLSAYVDDAVAVAEAVDADVILGNSLGGAVALQAALEREVDLDGLLLTGTGARLPVLDDVLQWVKDDFDRVVEFFHEPDHLFHDANERTLELSRRALRQTGRATMERDLLTAHDFDVRDRLGEIAVPALAAVGEYDRLTPPHYHERLRKDIPDCELRILDDAAHLAMLERPDAFNDAVADFLDRRVGD
ncbi:alpha/beta fold hydrolase [Halobellus rubicundus]|uniref:Alpha/beta fold hydrolase n=1 Tax=Halobellus rubicundus TaxID=2996466 RepID=A0ABD5MCC8_9EURY